MPFPSGMTMQQVSAQYMPGADPDDGAQALISLNNLRDPFIDEIGRDLPLTAPAVGGTVFVASGGRLVSGEQVTLSSRSQPSLSAVILDVKELGGSTMLSLSVDASGYDPADLAVVRAYAPGTIRGGQILWIPSSEEPTQDDFDVNDPSSPADQLPLLKMSGTDLLLDQSGDLVLTPDGDFLYARGLPLVAQAVRSAIATPRGALLRHPSYGMRETVGLTSGSFDLKDVSKSVRETFADDPLFRGVDGVAVDQDGATITVGVAMSVAGSNRPVPLSVQLQQR